MPVISRFISAVFILTGLLLLGGCTEDSQAPQGYEVTELNQVDFVREITADYLRLTDQIQIKYQLHKKTSDADGYMLYRNQQWTPEYIDLKRKYESVLNKSKAYVYRHQLDNLFDRFFDLQGLALHLKHSLQKQDWDLEQQAMKRLARDREEVASHPSRFN